MDNRNEYTYRLGTINREYAGQQLMVDLHKSETLQYDPRYDPPSTKYVLKDFKLDGEKLNWYLIIHFDRKGASCLRISEDEWPEAVQLLVQDMVKIARQRVQNRMKSIENMLM